MDKKSKEKIINLEIYTDGSCKSLGKKTFGGWSFIVVNDNKEIYSAAGHEEDTTNQRMELTAIKNSLEYAASARGQNEKVIIYSDSAYAINCYIENWYESWINNGWKNSQKKPVANQDLWINIVPFFDNFWYDFQKVPGHSGNYWNERCDDMAQDSANKAKINWRGKDDRTI